VSREPDASPKRIVLTSFGSYGDTYPYIGLALALRARGHEPRLAMAEYYRDLVEPEGLRFDPVRPNVDPKDRNTIARIMDSTRGTEFLLRDLLLPALRDSYEDLRHACEGADLLVTHPITFHAPLVAEARRIPWVSTVLAPMSFFSTHDLPVFPAAPWLKRLEWIPGAAPVLVALAKRVTRPWMEPVHALRQELKLPRGGDPLFAGQHSPHLVLALFSHLIADSQPDWPARVRVVGPVTYNGPAGGHPLSADTDAFLDAGPAPVVFTLGTSAVGAAGDFFAESLDAVRRLGVRAILLTGPYAENRPAGTVTDNVLLLEFAPHAALFPRAAAIVHQGGAGTLHQALRAGRPSLVVPFAHDQPDNAYRVARLGVSRTLHPSQYRAARVASELNTLLTVQAYARRAAAIADRVQREDGAATAAASIDELFS
jgi:UDP:flavonoid glycosyltransferase YjiC (YdhE family)